MRSSILGALFSVMFLVFFVVVMINFLNVG